MERNLSQFEDILHFLNQSNLIEAEPSVDALLQAVLAWEYLTEVAELELEAVLMCHAILMNNLNPEIAGHLRTVGVRVGSKICPNPIAVPNLIGEWFKNHAAAATEEAIKAAHIAFEGIHPFEDGNGRTGRIIMNWQRIKAGLPILIIYAGKEQEAYYSWFN